MYKLFFIIFVLLQSVNLIEVTYYEILGVSKQASTQEIRQAYKKLAVKYHPDKNPEAKVQEKFLKITEAYETLKDPDKRHNYDVYGSYPSYTKKYDYRSQAEYNNLFYNGLYHEDPFVDTVSGNNFFNYLQEGYHFINFYSPFCPPCQNLVDHWKKLGEIYKGIVKVAAVNCKYHNNFCYNSMRIGSYPSLLFYPSGRKGNYIYYRGERTIDALDQFIMSYLRSQVHVPTLTQVRGTDKPLAYVLGTNRVDRDSLTRIAYHLKGLVTLAILEDDNLRSKLTKNEYATIIYKYKGVTREIESTQESEILKEIVGALPKITMIDPDKLKKIRNQLRSGHKTPWVIYFSSKESDRDQDRLALHQLTLSHPDMHYGEIDCDTWGELCASLQAAEGGWGVLKAGGGYQRVRGAGGAPPAAAATALHSLTPAELARVLRGDIVSWVLAVVPHKVNADDLLDAFTTASLRYTGSGDIQVKSLFPSRLKGYSPCSVQLQLRPEWTLQLHALPCGRWFIGLQPCSFIPGEAAAARCMWGIVECGGGAGGECEGAGGQGALLVRAGGGTHRYAGRAHADDIAEFVDVLLDTADMELSEDSVLEVLWEGERRASSWAVAFLPAHCGPPCDQLAHQWRLLARRLRPLEGVHVGMLRCGGGGGPGGGGGAGAAGGGLCANVRAPTARLYRARQQHHHTVSLQQLSEAPYMAEWVLEYLLDSVRRLDSHTFTRLLLREELQPSGSKPWLVYFHSPRCYRCYEMYADFAIAGVHLNDAVQLGKVNCLTERDLCQREQITSYPSLRLYLPQGAPSHFSRVISIPVRDYDAMLDLITPHLRKYNPELLSEQFGVRRPGIHMKHDEF